MVISSILSPICAWTRLATNKHNDYISAGHYFVKVGIRKYYPLQTTELTAYFEKAIGLLDQPTVRKGYSNPDHLINPTSQTAKKVLNLTNQIQRLTQV